VDRVLRLAVEIDATGEVENIILVEMDTAGTVTETYRIPLDNEAGKVTVSQECSQNWAASADPDV
jgi:hypothetical protein